MTLFPPQVDTWIEPFAGSCALALALQGAGRPPFSYQGGKATLAGPTLGALGLRPGGRAVRYELNDLSFAPWAIGMIQGYGLAIADAIDRIPEGRPGFDRILSDGVSPDPTIRAAQFVALMACSPHGKVPRPDGLTWKVHGYAAVSPAGIRRGFRERLNPGALSRKVRRLHRGIRDAPIRFSRVDASKFWPRAQGRTVVYLDPPYARTTGYRAGCDRDEVIVLARAWATVGASVAVAEGEPLSDRHLRIVRTDGRPLVRPRPEYVSLFGEWPDDIGRKCSGGS